MTRFHHLIDYVSRTPLAIDPDKGFEILSYLAWRAQGGDADLSADELAELYAGFSPLPLAVDQNRDGQTSAVQRARVTDSRPGQSIAVLSMRGIIGHRADQVESASSANGTSTEGFGMRLDAAMDNPNIGGIMIDVDSPGGTTDGVPELAAKIRNARGGDKRIVAVANTRALSAAYWLASQADELVVTPSGDVGSIGVYAAHQDLSGAFAKKGVVTSLIYAGKYKIEGQPFAPLDDEARAELQLRVDDHHAEFIDAVAEGRGKRAKVVREQFGEGRAVRASDAAAAGMVDRVETFDQALGRMAGTLQAAAKRRNPCRPRGQATADKPRLRIEAGGELVDAETGVPVEIVADERVELEADRARSTATQRRRFSFA